MAEKTGFLEKWQKGMVLSMVEVKYRRVGVKKTPRKKLFKPETLSHKEDHYYVLDKKTKLGSLSLTGSSVFSPKELVEVELNVALYNARLRLLGKIGKVTTFMEIKRAVFRGDIQFAAVNKSDFDHLIELDDQKRKREGTIPGKKESHKVTFKRK